MSATKKLSQILGIKPKQFEDKSTQDDIEVKMSRNK
jgi:hypothetical protein